MGPRDGASFLPSERLSPAFSSRRIVLVSFAIHLRMSERMSMKRSFLRSAISLIALFCFAATGRAQRPREPEVVYPPQLLSDLAALRDAALSSDYAYQQVAHLTENIGPRMGASPQAERGRLCGRANAPAGTGGAPGGSAVATLGAWN